MPIERKNAMVNVESFLIDLRDPKKTPRVPKEIREKACRLLRHYPSKYHMEEAQRLAPSVFGEYDD